MDVKVLDVKERRRERHGAEAAVGAGVLDGASSWAACASTLERTPAATSALDERRKAVAREAALKAAQTAAAARAKETASLQAAMDSRRAADEMRNYEAARRAALRLAAAEGEGGEVSGTSTALANATMSATAASCDAAASNGAQAAGRKWTVQPSATRMRDAQRRAQEAVQAWIVTQVSLPTHLHGYTMGDTGGLVRSTTAGAPVRAASSAVAAHPVARAPSGLRTGSRDWVAPSRGSTPSLLVQRL